MNNKGIQSSEIINDSLNLVIFQPQNARAWKGHLWVILLSKAQSNKSSSLTHRLLFIFPHCSCFHQRFPEEGPIGTHTQALVSPSPQAKAQLSSECSHSQGLPALLSFEASCIIGSCHPQLLDNIKVLTWKLPALVYTFGVLGSFQDVWKKIWMTVEA